MIPIFKKNYQKRIWWMNLSAVVLMLIILLLVFGFLGTVIAFEYQGQPKNTISEVLDQETNRLRVAVQEGERNIKQLKSEKDLPDIVKINSIQNNLKNIEDELKGTQAHLNELSKIVNENKQKILEQYLNEKRVLLVFAGLFIAYLVKLFAGLYKYNAYLKSHYLSILDSLDLSQELQNPKEKLDLNRFTKLFSILSAKQFSIDSGGTIIDDFVTKKVETPTK